MHILSDWCGHTERSLWRLAPFTQQVFEVHPSHSVILFLFVAECHCIVWIPPPSFMRLLGGFYRWPLGIILL